MLSNIMSIFYPIDFASTSIYDKLSKVIVLFRMKDTIKDKTWYHEMIHNLKKDPEICNMISDLYTFLLCDTENKESSQDNSKLEEYLNKLDEGETLTLEESELDALSQKLWERENVGFIIENNTIKLI